MFAKKFTEIPIDQIYVNNSQPRKYFAEEHLIELRDSIKEFGILQPLLLKRANNGKYLIIAGERRWRAALMAGFDKVPAVIKEADEMEVDFISLIENIQREDLGYIEEAVAYNNIMEKYGITQFELSKRLGKNQSTISNKIRILSLPEDIQEKLVDNKLTERHARALLKIKDNSDRRIIVDKILKHSLNVKQTEKLIDDYNHRVDMTKREKNKILHISYKLYLNTFKKAFDDMELSEKGATFLQEDNDDCIRMLITIPKI